MVGGGSGEAGEAFRHALAIRIRGERPFGAGDGRVRRVGDPFAGFRNPAWTMPVPPSLGRARVAGQKAPCPASSKATTMEAEVQSPPSCSTICQIPRVRGFDRSDERPFAPFTRSLRENLLNRAHAHPSGGCRRHAGGRMTGLATTETDGATLAGSREAPVLRVNGALDSAVAVQAILVRAEALTAGIRASTASPSKPSRPFANCSSRWGRHGALADGAEILPGLLWQCAARWLPATGRPFRNCSPRRPGAAIRCGPRPGGDRLCPRHPLARPELELPHHDRAGRCRPVLGLVERSPRRCGLAGKRPAFRA